MLETCRPEIQQCCTLAKIRQDCDPPRMRSGKAVVLHVSMQGSTSRVYHVVTAVLVHTPVPESEESVGSLSSFL